MGFRISRVFKLFVVLSFVFHNVSAVDWQQKTLSEFTQACFEQFPLRKSFDKDKYTFFSTEEIEAIVKEIKDKFKDKGFTDKKNWLNQKGSPAENFTGEKVWDCVQKKVIPAGSKVCFMGDIHGSLHSLLRNLKRLQLLDFLGDDFKLKEGNYMVFLGDYVDRGTYGIEVLYLLMCLKLANWDKVILLRGNHELVSINEDPVQGGFSRDLKEY